MDFRKELRWAMTWPLVALFLTSIVLIGLVLYVQNASSWVDHTDQVIAQTTLVERLVSGRQSRFRGFLLTRTPSLLTTAIETDGRALSALDELQQLVNDNASQVARLEALRPVMGQWKRYSEEQVARLHNAQDPPASHDPDGDAIHDQTVSQLKEFARIEKDLGVALPRRR